ncbi:CHC2 zinc finger domain-containing protein [Xanthobacter autotrophicus]|uniref:DUF7146 domain-containing protein n=1 Tax=Xanthobacter autotrophicus TaxID=280 RepID=UPI0037268259
MTAALTDLAFAEWVAQARAVAVLDELGRRGITLKRAGTEMVGPCPVCGGRDRFGVHLRKGLWHCRGSGLGGDAIALVQYLDGADFLAACETLTGQPPPRGEGSRLSPEELATREDRRRRQEAEGEREANRYREAERKRLYFNIWKHTVPLAGTLAEAYLARRGIPNVHSAALRFHPALPYFHGQVQDARGFDVAREIYRGPAMVAAITDASGKFRGLHQTWIDLSTPRGKAEIIDPDTGELLEAKKVRGSKQGGHILVLPAERGPARRIYAAEGIETLLSVWVALAATCAEDLSGSAFACAADLGNLAGRATETIPHPTALTTDKAGRQRRVRVPGPVPDFGSAAMPIPPECTELVLLGDGDSEPFLTEMAMVRAQRRHAAPGRDVRVVMAPAGQDFNDLLRAPEQARRAVANGATSNSPTQHREGAAA